MEEKKKDKLLTEKKLLDDLLQDLTSLREMLRLYYAHEHGRVFDRKQSHALHMLFYVNPLKNEELDFIRTRQHIALPENGGTISNIDIKEAFEDITLLERYKEYYS